MSDGKPATIFALSSGRPPAAIAVIRISGPRAGAALEALGVKVPAPRQAKLARVRDPRSGEMLDEALALWFPGPNSETGEDVAELQGHGGPAVVAAILDALGSIDGLRMAEPGEFTRRGFENGKLDLTAVEGLADLVAAETEGQRRQAFRQMKGLLGDRAETWRKRLIQALALVEARIDFSDEADVPEDLVGPALAIVQELRDEIGTALADGRRGERLREGLVVAIAGPPNAGKSTLLNRLAQREAAIVSPYAGTTRDVIEVHLDLGGFPMTLLDTAGIRDTDDPVEMEGVRRARERAAAADLVLWLTDASEPGEERPDLAAQSGRHVPIWQIATKIDLLDPASAAMLRSKEAQHSGAGGFMLRSNQGVDGPVGGSASSGAGPEGRDSGRLARSSETAAVAPRDSVHDLAQATKEGPEGGAVRGPTSPERLPREGRPAGHAPEAAAGGLAPVTRASERPELEGVAAGDLGPKASGAEWPGFVAGAADSAEREGNEQAFGRSEPGVNYSAGRNQSTDINEPSFHIVSEYEFTLSGQLGTGVDRLVTALFRFAERQLAGAEQALVTRERHRQSLVAVQHILSGLLTRFGGSRSVGQEELLAEELRRAAVELGRLTGRVDVEDILDVIFRDFCIGK